MFKEFLSKALHPNSGKEKLPNREKLLSQKAEKILAKCFDNITNQINWHYLEKAPFSLNYPEIAIVKIKLAELHFSANLANKVQPHIREELESHFEKSYWRIARSTIWQEGDIKSGSEFVQGKTAVLAQNWINSIQTFAELLGGSYSVPALQLLIKKGEEIQFNRRQLFQNFGNKD